MFARLANLVFPPGKLSNSFPWTVQTAGKKYFGGLLRFAIGSFAVPIIFMASMFALAYYPLMRASFLETGQSRLAKNVKIWSASSGSDSCAKSG